MQRFADRVEAGRELAGKLQAYHEHAVVYALPRGGVETGVEVARELEVPLDLVIARKIGHPADPEYAVCAVTEIGPLVCNERERANLDELWLQQAEQRERAEAKRRREIYLEDSEPVSCRDKVAIVVDDGIATGLTMRAAVAEVQKQVPRKVVVAVPCAPREAVEELRELANEVIVLADPDDYLSSVGSYYDSFPQVSDTEVLALLDDVHGRSDG